MQTFLPYSDFVQSLACLDYRRLGKQRVEAFQLLIANGNEWAINERSRKNPKPVRKGWVNHPAAVMWRGYDEALGLYMNIAIAEWLMRGYKNTMAVMPVFSESQDIFVNATAVLPRERLIEYYNDLQSNIEMPPWLGDEDFHASHRANLLRKKPKHYAQFEWTEDPKMEYVWPTRNKVYATL